MKQNKSNEYTEWSNHLGIWYRGNYKNDEQIGYVESNCKGIEGIGDIATTVDFFIR